MSLLNHPAHQLVHETDVAALGKALRNLPFIDAATAQTLDQVYGARTLAALRSPSDRQALAELSEHLELATTPNRKKQLAALGIPYAARWRAWQELLEILIESLDKLADSGLPNLKHVKGLLEILEQQGELPQSELAQKLGLKPANLTRLLNILEANLLIRRQAVGREKQVGLSSVYRAKLVTAKPQPSRANAVTAKSELFARPRLTLISQRAA